MLALGWFVVILNYGRATNMDVIPCTEGDTTTPNTEVGSVPFVPPIFYQDPYILLR